jgi:hypothetical protein
VSENVEQQLVYARSANDLLRLKLRQALDLNEDLKRQVLQLRERCAAEMCLEPDHRQA